MTGTALPRFDGQVDRKHAIEGLAALLPAPLKPLARLAYNYWWSWSVEGRDLFSALDPHAWQRSGANPVRLLNDLPSHRLEELAADPAVTARIGTLVQEFNRATALPDGLYAASNKQAAFMCAEFGIHHSLPLYAGGLGVLAGDFLKEASDRGLPVIGVGLLYWEGSFHQRFDGHGWQQEYWLPLDPERLPIVPVTGPDGLPLIVHVSIRWRPVAARVWRADIGRVTLFLLDTNLPENSMTDRWITARLYVGDRETRLAQYTLLGVGGVRALRAMGITPEVFHLNEGHAAFAALELVREAVEKGRSVAEGLADARARTIFTTHTPVAAGNETYAEADLRGALDGIPESCGFDWDGFLALGRVHPGDRSERFGMTPFALRTSRVANGVSRRHGEVSRGMWHDLWPDRPLADVPIDHVTNGVHLPTWMAPPMQALLDQYLGAGWRERAADSATWAAIERLPDEELWAVRCRLRADLVAFVRQRSVWDRLGRGASTAYAEAAAREWQTETLTLGFARRIATYKRLYVLMFDQERASRLLGGPNGLQMVLAGKAHPQDEDAKRSVQGIFHLDAQQQVGGRAVFLEDYDLEMAWRLVAGCDVWINLPRPPLEACGTSGMKSALNGGLQLAVLDGWWAEAWDGSNGWAIDGQGRASDAEADASDARALLDLLQGAIVPLFYDRDACDLPRHWIRRIKDSMQSLGPSFNASRMLDLYAARYEATIATRRLHLTDS
jgi:glycogen phosphorylase